MRERFGRLKDMKEGREFIFFPPPARFATRS